MLALWRTWWMGHRSKNYGGFKPGRLENVLVLFIRNWEETNRRKNIWFWREEVKFSFSFELERGWYPLAVLCGRPTVGHSTSGCHPWNRSPSGRGCPVPVCLGVLYPVIISEVVQKEGPIIYGKEIKGTHLLNIRALCF